MERDLWRWDAVDLAAAIRTRRISSHEATRAVLERLAAVNPVLNAVTVLLADQALAAADRADAAVRRGDALGPLHGVPVTIKENIDQEGVATPNGVPAFKDLVAKSDSPPVRTGGARAPSSSAAPTRPRSVCAGTPTTSCAAAPTTRGIARAPPAAAAAAPPPRSPSASRRSPTATTSAARSAIPPIAAASRASGRRSAACRPTTRRRPRSVRPARS